MGAISRKPAGPLNSTPATLHERQSQRQPRFHPRDPAASQPTSQEQRAWPPGAAHAATGGSGTPPGEAAPVTPQAAAGRGGLTRRRPGFWHLRPCCPSWAATGEPVASRTLSSRSDPASRLPTSGGGQGFPGTVLDAFRVLRRRGVAAARRPGRSARPRIRTAPRIRPTDSADARRTIFRPPRWPRRR